ncbi:MAG: DNA replication and repair protein RecF [Litorilinea sp.]|nr:MAG: DNA replication and repair protein RecF [Litorilinea sp.]
MFLAHLSLTHFRNYHRLELDFTRRLTLLQGHNAQGKTNLLEAIYFLATSKPVHALAEREVVDWQAQQEPIPFCRVAARVELQEGERPRSLELEIILAPRGENGHFAKQVKINGVNRRSLDLVGLMRAVLFLPEDVKLVDGSPGERRRYLDIALCQIDPAYCRALSAYQKVLTQRNSLLKQLREALGTNRARPHDPAVEAQLSFWDEKLAQHGSYVVARRHNFILALEQIARTRHHDLTNGLEELALQYVPGFNPGHLSAMEYELLRAGGEPSPQEWQAIRTPLAPQEVATHFLAKLASRRSRELAAGATLYGPHRDDFRFLANGRDLRTYGSRGQQRTAALSLKLAEVQAMTEATGVAPLLLLDDVMSELDARRRRTLLQVLDGVAQAIVTTTDWEDFTPEFRRQAQLLQVRNGTVEPASAGPQELAE